MAKCIMIQGTMSNVGKSVLCAGLCRIFKQDGYRVAPFKSQNMALNSFITREGLEMGRAQVMQAEAAGVEPIVAMNPILLKPTNDIGSQVIVNGEVIGTMPAREYFNRKKSLIPEILKAYERLDRAYDIIVIEGAGSPAEINLKKDDIVNMGLAALVDAPVLLVGDIDRGGVFAQLYGTTELLEPAEKQRIKGLIINKFRGDKTILDPGVEMLKELTGLPVVGVTPYLNVQLEDEDSLSERFTAQTKVDLIDIAVIRLPRISNFTDFNIFESIAGVSLRYVHTASQLGHPDLIFLPGTKNTISDLLWLRQSGLEAAILKANRAGCLIFGICGGYQMLGTRITDAEGAEGGGSVRGMNLLPMETTFTAEKKRTRVCGSFLALAGPYAPLFMATGTGYEIHMGHSTSTATASTMDTAAASDTAAPDTAASAGDASPLLLLTDTITGAVRTEGLCRGRVCGTYVHGLFDAKETAEALVQVLAREKGIEGMAVSMDYGAFKERQYDLLADGLRAHLDMEAIYRILDESA